MSAAQAGLDSDQLECVFTRPVLVRGIFPGKEARQASQIDCLFNGTPVVALRRRLTKEHSLVRDLLGQCSMDLAAAGRQH